MAGVIRWCGWVQVCLMIQMITLRWNSIVQMHCTPQWKVWCMLSRQTMMMLQRIILLIFFVWCGAPDDTDCTALDYQEVVAMYPCHQKTTRFDNTGECTPHWSQVHWGWASKPEGPGGETHFMGYFRTIEGLSLVVNMFFISVGRDGESQQHLWTMVWWMATRYLGGFFDFIIAERDISDNAFQQTCSVSHPWRIQWVTRGTPSRTSEAWKCPH